ncbi:unnamed protein product [Lepidochelys kempii]
MGRVGCVGEGVGGMHVGGRGLGCVVGVREGREDGVEVWGGGEMGWGAGGDVWGRGGGLGEGVGGMHVGGRGLGCVVGVGGAMCGVGVSVCVFLSPLPLAPEGSAPLPQGSQPSSGFAHHRPPQLGPTRRLLWALYSCPLSFHPGTGARQPY